MTEVNLNWGVQIPLRDGIRLSATLYLPANGSTPAPTLFSLTPYTAHRNHARAMYFASHDFPFLIVDVRGRGNSEGVFQPFIQEAQDGHDVVQWIAQQSFCNGRVAMFSGSYEGYAQWATAKEFPPNLATIVPGMAAAPGLDFPMRNNVPHSYIVQWLLFTAGRTSQDRIFEDAPFWREKFRGWFESGRPFSELDSWIGSPSEIFQEWLNHPESDSYWDSFRPSAAEFSQINLPVLTLTGAYDGDQPGALYYYREHTRLSTIARENHFLIIGPWDHAGVLAPKSEVAGLKLGAASMLDILELHRQWYEWTLREGPRPAFLQKQVAYYVTGAEKWRYAESLDAITTRVEPLYLSSPGTASCIFGSGLLRACRGGGTFDSYTYDPKDTNGSRMEALATDLPCLRPTFPTDNLASQASVYSNDGKQLVYHSEPFQRDREISGFFRLVTWISIDQPDTDFSVAVYEIRDDGGSVLLTADLLRARYREGLRESKPVATTVPLCYSFELFTFVSRELAKGSRLRLVIGPVNSIFSQKNYNSGGIVAQETIADACIVNVKLFHDESHPSVLFVPFGLEER